MSGNLAKVREKAQSQGICESVKFCRGQLNRMSCLHFVCTVISFSIRGVDRDFGLIKVAIFIWRAVTLNTVRPRYFVIDLNRDLRGKWEEQDNEIRR